MPATEKIREEMCRLNLINAAKTSLLHDYTRKKTTFHGWATTNRQIRTLTTAAEQEKELSWGSDPIQNISSKIPPRYLLIETPKRNMESTCGMALNKKSI